MPATVVEIAEAVKDALNAATLSQSFTAVRAYAPVYEEDDFSTLRVSVVAVDQSLEILSRGGEFFAYQVNVTVQKKVGRGVMDNAAFNAACDQLMLLAEEIIDLFRMQRLAGYESAFCSDVENPLLSDADNLDQHKIFSSVIRFTFKVSRPR